MLARAHSTGNALPVAEGHTASADDEPCELRLILLNSGSIPFVTKIYCAVVVIYLINTAG